MNIKPWHKRIFRLFFWLLFLSVSGCESWNPPRKKFSADLTTGLVAYYPFAGNTQDVSGNQLHGQFINGATLGPDRKDNSNSALTLDGINDYFEIPDHPKLRSDAISISFWVKCRSIGGTSHLYNKSTFSDNTNQQYSAFIRPPRAPNPTNGSGFELIADASQDGKCSLEQPISDFVLLYDPSFQTNQWYHFVSVISRKTGRIYLNGVEKQANTNLPDSPIDNCSGGNLRFGAQSAYVNDFNYLDGSFDEIRIYNRVLTEADIKALYQK